MLIAPPVRNLIKKKVLPRINIFYYLFTTHQWANKDQKDIVYQLKAKNNNYQTDRLYVMSFKCLESS